MWCLRFENFTFWNSCVVCSYVLLHYVMWRLRYVALRNVATPTRLIRHSQAKLHRTPHSFFHCPLNSLTLPRAITTHLPMYSLFQKHIEGVHVQIVDLSPSSAVVKSFFLVGPPPPSPSPSLWPGRPGRSGWRVVEVELKGGGVMIMIPW
jgi:hypothetical protein